MSDHPLRVLVVDDERNIADTLSQILQAQGFDSRAAYDGSAALIAAQTFAPEVLITDVVMPGLSGWDVAMEYSRLLPDCRVILFSGDAEMDECPEQEIASDFEVYTKPVPPRVFISRLKAESELLH
jgi:DNA-binding response OmpR family regulator